MPQQLWVHYRVTGRCDKKKIDPTRSEEVAIVEELAAGVVAVLLPSHSG